MSENIIRAIREAIERELPDSQVSVTGGQGHYSVEVVSTAFAGKGTLDSHKLVYGAITHLMRGDNAPVHAIDRLRTKTP